MQKDAAQAQPPEYEDDNVCTKAAGCPRCGERSKDALEWDEDGVMLTCRCGMKYEP